MGVNFRSVPRVAAICTVTLSLGACAVTSPIQSASTSKSAFEGAVYKGRTVIINPGTPGNPAFRVFIQGATGFVSMQSVRDDAEQRATAFCDRKGKAMESLTETTATPPYILGNFPRIEIVFDCIEKQGSVAPASSDDKYARLAKLKQLLDSGAITQQEFNQEKAKILAQP
jgi:putative oligomerization/nucleic acid binding protein